MTHFIISVLDSAFGEGKLLPARFNSARRRQILVTISGQEADLRHRWQVVDPKHPEHKGPARGLWQFELAGVRGVMRHPVSEPWLRSACQRAGVDFIAEAVWQALAVNDALACALACCLLLTDPEVLPALGDVDGSFACYHKLWRPGAYYRGTAAQRAQLRERWAGNYARATRILREGETA